MPGSKWVIVGGESGPGARTINPEWVRDILIGNCLAGLSRTAVPPTNLLLAGARAPSGLEGDGEPDQRWRHYDHHGPRDHLNRCPLPILQREALANVGPQRCTKVSARPELNGGYQGSANRLAYPPRGSLSALDRPRDTPSL